MANDTPLAVVQAMWDAWRDGRIDDVIATMSPEIVWTPLTRPARSLYSGHNAVRQFRKDSVGVHGAYRTEVKSYTPHEAGRVTVRGIVIVRDDGDEYVKLAFVAECLVRDGLIIRIDSRQIDSA